MGHRDALKQGLILWPGLEEQPQRPWLQKLSAPKGPRALWLREGVLRAPMTWGRCSDGEGGAPGGKGKPMKGLVMASVVAP